MIEGRCECGHDIWEHESEETVHEDGDESIYFGVCMVDLCDCRHYEEKSEVESMFDELSQPNLNTARNITRSGGKK